MTTQTITREDEREAESIMADAEEYQNFVPLQRLADRKGFIIAREPYVESMSPEDLRRGDWYKIDDDMVTWAYSAELDMDNEWPAGYGVAPVSDLDLVGLVAFLHSQPDAPDPDDEP